MANPYTIRNDLKVLGNLEVVGTTTQTGDIATDTISEETAAAGVTVDGVLNKDGGIVLADGATIEADIVNEATAAAGVTVDGVVIKDGGAVFADGAAIDVDTINEATAANGVVIDGVTLKDGSVQATSIGFFTTLLASTGITLQADASNGPGFSILKANSGDTALDTGDAETAITLGIPGGAFILGTHYIIGTEIAGTDSTTVTVDFTGGNAQASATGSVLTAGAEAVLIHLGNALMVTSATTEATFTLSGGADNDPSAGSVDVTVFYAVITNS